MHQYVVPLDVPLPVGGGPNNMKLQLFTPLNLRPGKKESNVKGTGALLVSSPGGRARQGEIPGKASA